MQCRALVFPLLFFFFQAEDGIRDWSVTGVQTCALPICTATPDSVSGVAVLEARTIQVDDILGPAGERFSSYARGEQATRQRLGLRTVLATPMVLGGAVVGSIMLRRREVRPFDERQVRLLEGFANQAA